MTSLIASRQLSKTVYLRSLLQDGIKPIFPTMTSPPTFSKSTGNTSSVDATYVNNSVKYNGQSTVLSWLGGIYGNTSNSGVNTKWGQVTTASDASKSGGALSRLRFQTNSEAVDFCFNETLGLSFNVIIDGQIARRTKPFGFANSGNIRWAKVDLGANAITYALDLPVLSPVSGGSGYAVNDIITLNGGGGGAGGTPATLRVAQVSSGAVFFATVESHGAYTSQPTGNFGQASTTGSGTGATFSTAIMAKRQSTRKMRTWEVLMGGLGSSLLGIVTAPGSTILAAPANPFTPKLMIIGDSIVEGTYTPYAGAGVGQNIAQMLGLWENHVISAKGGTGWNVNSGTSLRWSHASRIADIVAEAPDILVFIGSGNDTSGTTLQTAITTALNSIQTSLPRTMIIGTGPIVGDSTTLANSIGTGFANATNQTKIRFLNNHTPDKWVPSATIGDWHSVGDAAHPHDDAIQWWSQMAATQIAKAICEMTLIA